MDLQLTDKVAVVTGANKGIGLARTADRSTRPRLNQRLAGATLSPQAHAALAQARGQTLARVQPARAGLAVADAVQSASVHAFHVGIGISASLVALGGLLGLAGIRNPRRLVRCADCVGGQLAGQPIDAGLTQRTRIQPQPAAPAAPTADTVT